MTARPGPSSTPLCSTAGRSAASATAAPFLTPSTPMLRWAMTTRSAASFLITSRVDWVGPAANMWAQIGTWTRLRIAAMSSSPLTGSST